MQEMRLAEFAARPAARRVCDLHGLRDRVNSLASFCLALMRHGCDTGLMSAAPVSFARLTLARFGRNACRSGAISSHVFGFFILAFSVLIQTCFGKRSHL